AANALYMFPGGGAASQPLSSNSTYFIIVAMSGLVLAVTLNVVGLNVGKWLNNVGAVASWVPMLFLLVLGILSWSRFGSATPMPARAFVPNTSLKDVIFWSTIAFAFGRVHPRWRTPYVALLVQALIAAFFVFIGQAGTSVRGAYDALVSMGIIAYFIPFLFMFAAMIVLQREPAGPDVIRVPGGSTAAIALAALGFVTTAVSPRRWPGPVIRRGQSTRRTAANIFSKSQTPRPEGLCIRAASAQFTENGRRRPKRSPSIGRSRSRSAFRRLTNRCASSSAN